MTVIFLDLDNTLVDRCATVLAYAEVFRHDFQSSLNSSAVAEELGDIFNRLDKGGYSTHEIRSRAIADLSIWSDPVDPQKLLDHWQSWVPYNAVAMPALTNTLDELAAQNHPLCLVSNGTGVNQRAKLNCLQIDGYFEQVIISGEVNIKKPDIGIFNFALESMSCSAENSVFVGDHPVNDIWGAQQAGMVPVWFSGSHQWPVDQPEPEHTIQSLAELPGLIRGLELNV